MTQSANPKGMAGERHRLYVLQFKELGGGDLDLVGGKGANLAELVQAGVSVPDGFCVTVAAYRHFLERIGAGQAIAQVLENHAGEGMAAAKELSETISALIAEHDVPEDICQPILSAYDGLQQTRVGVRSSATAEDLPGFSFAGQQDTYLGIEGADAVVDAVKRCWISLWTPRAIHYRQTHGFRHQDVYIAVVVQVMFPSEVSGVLFTVDPLTGDRRRMIVNGSWGLGESIVSGAVTPDSWLIDRSSSVILEEHIGEKAERIDQEPGKSGVVHRSVEIRDRERPCLSADQLAELVRIGCRIEAHYGYPQDVEWGFAEGQFAVLQTREVTGVPVDFGDELERWNVTDPKDDQVVWSRAWADAFQTSPTTPLMYTIQQSFIARSYDDMYELYGLRSFRKRRMYRWFRTRPYYNADYEAARLQLIPRFARNDDALAFFPPDDKERVRNLPFQWWKLAYAQLHALFKAPRYSFPWCADTFYKEYPEQVARYKKAMSVDFGKAAFEDLLERFQASEQCFFDHARSTTPGIMDYCYLLVLALSELLKNWAGDGDQAKFGALLSGLSTKTVLENIEIWRLARKIHRSAKLRELFEEADPSAILDKLPASSEGAAYLKEVKAFIAENGHRGASERDLAFPRWHHRPELFISTLRSLSSADEASDPEETEQRMRRKREETTAEIDRLLRAQKAGMFKAAIFRSLLKWTLKYVRMRDDQRYYADYYMAARHDFFNAIGARLHERLLIDDAGDVFFLGLEELQDLWAGRLSRRHARRRIEARRDQHEKYTQDTPPFFMRSGHAIATEEDSWDGTTLSGIAASSGTVTARARVCKTLEEAGNIQKGEILVARATDPGWTAVFSMIGGVAIETGGPLAHATLVSREYGIPCVTSVSRATELIQDGEIITVDGGLGRIMLDRGGDANDGEEGRSAANE